MATLPQVRHFAHLLRAQSEIETLLREVELPGKKPGTSRALSDFEEKVAMLQNQLAQIKKKTTALRKTSTKKPR